MVRSTGNWHFAQNFSHIQKLIIHTECPWVFVNHICQSGQSDSQKGVPKVFVKQIICQSKVWVIYVQQPDEIVGITYRDHGVDMESCASECSKNVTEIAIATMEGTHKSATSTLLDDSFLPDKM